MLDGLDDVADAHGKSVGVSHIVLHHDVIFRGSL